MTQTTWYPTPCYMGHFQIFDKIDGFLKNVLNVFTAKEISYVFEQLLNLLVIVG